jgi:hypothetical protein
VLWHRETAHGMKAIWDDGHLAELAVFDPIELRLARVNRYRVLLDRADVAGQMRALREATAARGAAELPDERWVAGQFLGALLVGAGRAARGESLSGHVLVRSVALAHLLDLVRRHVPPAAGAVLDDLDPFRRVERGWPALDREIEDAPRARCRPRRARCSTPRSGRSVSERRGLTPQRRRFGVDCARQKPASVDDPGAPRPATASECGR